MHPSDGMVSSATDFERFQFYIDLLALLDAR
jgi:hypothetical protein